MKIISDLHVHSRFSRATSKTLNIANLEKYAKIKGLNLLGTGDFTHPEWLKELKNELIEDGSGILKTKNGFNFLLQTEVSLIYTDNGKGRRIHNIVLAKNFDIVEQINAELRKKGRLDYDGRPIFGMSCVEFVELMKNIDKDIEIIPAHAWTPHFSLFGSMSGFDSVEECFKDQTKHIHAIETGLSSDPAMNWRLSQLDKYTLVSSSDAHSFWPWRIGREANVFDIEQAYDNLIGAIRTRKGFLYTIEVNVNLGKYHLTGHRGCGICLEPKDSVKLKDICPKCGRKLTVGVAQRIEALADRPEGYIPKGAIPFKTLIPLSELLSKILQSSVATNKVWKEYYKIVNHFGSEFNVLLEASRKELDRVTDKRIVDVIMLNREGKIKVKGGYDGVYGIPIINEEYLIAGEETKPKHKQMGLDDFTKD